MEVASLCWGSVYLVPACSFSEACCSDENSCGTEDTFVLNLYFIVVNVLEGMCSWDDLVAVKVVSAAGS